MMVRDSQLLRYLGSHSALDALVLQSCFTHFFSDPRDPMVLADLAKFCGEGGSLLCAIGTINPALDRV